MKDINYSFYDFSDICCFFLTNDCQVCAREHNREDWLWHHVKQVSWSVPVCTAGSWPFLFWFSVPMQSLQWQINSWHLGPSFCCYGLYSLYLWFCKNFCLMKAGFDFILQQKKQSNILELAFNFSVVATCPNCLR